jgi:hypothetical protein
MEIGIPTWNANTMSYSFRILKSSYAMEQTVYCESSALNFPASSSVSEAFVEEFLEKTKKYFTNPLTPEKVLKHLRHTVDTANLSAVEAGWYKLTWKPSVFVIKSGDFALQWELADMKNDAPIIPAEFTASTTPRGQSPVPEQPQELRNIQIHDSLIPVGDLPLSDLPPLSFGTEQGDPVQEEIKRRVREARLKVQLAKLKAQRMEHKYFERYGQQIEDSEDSSEFSSDSEEEEEIPFERHSHA